MVEALLPTLYMIGADYFASLLFSMPSDFLHLFRYLNDSAVAGLLLHEYCCLNLPGDAPATVLAKRQKATDDYCLLGCTIALKQSIPAAETRAVPRNPFLSLHPCEIVLRLKGVFRDSRAVMLRSSPPVLML